MQLREVNAFVHAEPEDQGVFDEQLRRELNTVVRGAFSARHLRAPRRQIGNVGAAPTGVLRRSGRPEADPRVHPPRIEIVHTSVTWAREIGNLVLRKASAIEFRPSPLVKRGFAL